MVDLDDSSIYAILQLEGEKYQLPIKKGTNDPKTIDVTSLYRESGYFTYDPGFMSTASCDSKITFINGEKGDLLHRGYRIEDLAQKGDFLEVAYLLLNGELPNISQKDELEKSLKEYNQIPDRLEKIFSAFPDDAHPMAMMVSTVGALSSYYHNNVDIADDQNRKKIAHQIIAKMSIIAAMCYKHSIGEPFVSPRTDLSYTENFLYMCFAKEGEEYKIDPTVVKALDLLFLLHADHEQNASTSTVRVCGSSGANPFATIAAAISSLWGPAHGGANEAVINMLQEIGNASNIPTYVKKAKDKQDPFRLMGFGHRVYKNNDPRAFIIKEACHNVLKALGKEDEPLMKMAVTLEEVATKDPYFIERKLYPNVDFYSGIIYKAIGIPPEMFTVMFALGRTTGWLAQWLEMMGDKSTKIARPRQLYTGHKERSYISIEARP